MFTPPPQKALSYENHHPCAIFIASSNLFFFYIWESWWIFEKFEQKEAAALVGRGAKQFFKLSVSFVSREVFFESSKKSSFWRYWLERIGLDWATGNPPPNHPLKRRKKTQKRGKEKTEAKGEGVHFLLSFSHLFIFIQLFCSYCKSLWGMQNCFRASLLGCEEFVLMLALLELLCWQNLHFTSGIHVACATLWHGHECFN